MEAAALKDSRPVKIRMLLVDAVRICKEHPRDFFGMAAIVSLAPLALGLISIARDPKDMMSPRNALPGLLQLALVIVTVVYVMYMLGAFPFLAARALDGRKASWTEAFSWLRERGLLSGVFLVLLLQILAAFGGLLLLIIPGIYFAVILMLVVPARVLGDYRGREALSESSRIVRPVLFRGGLSFAGVFFIPWAALLILQFVFGLMYGFTATSPIRVIPPAFATYLVTVFWSPIDQVAHALLYIERSGGVSAQRKDLFV